MSNSVSTAFVKQYEADVHEAYQRQGSLLRNAVRGKSGVVGSTTTFQKVGKGTATGKSRHGVVLPMNADHSTVECALSDKYAADYVDKLDELKTNIDERRVVSNAGAFALGRETDAQIITALSGASALSGGFVLTSAATVRNSMLAMVEGLLAADVPSDGQIYAALTPRSWSSALTVKEFSDSQYVGPSGLPLQEGMPVGRWKEWNGVLWTVHTGVTGRGTSSAYNYIWHRTAIGHAVGQDVTSDMAWIAERAAWFINNMMSMGAVLIDSVGALKAAVDDTAAIPTT